MWRADERWQAVLLSVRHALNRGGCVLRPYRLQVGLSTHALAAAAGQPVSPGFSAIGMIAVATSVTTTALQW